VSVNDAKVSVTTYSTANADPNEVAVAKLQIADDITAASVEVRVTNPGEGTSDPLILTIDKAASGAPFVQGANAGSATGGVRVYDEADIEEYGHNLAGATDASWSGIDGLTFSNTQVQSFPVPGDPDLFKVTAHVVASNITSQTADKATNLMLTVNGVQSNPFGFAIFAAAPPQIDSIEPSTVVRDSQVWIKFKGSHFGSTPLVQSDAPRASTYLDPGDSSDPDHVKVEGFWFRSDAPGAVHVTIRNQHTFLTSNSVTITVVDSDPAVPHVTSEPLTQIHRGNTYQNVTFLGSNLQNPSQVSAPQLQGLTFSNMKAAANGSSFSCTIAADNTATLSSEEATNLTLKTNHGDSNLSMIRIYP
jgi:hypothetical protein